MIALRSSRRALRASLWSSGRLYATLQTQGPWFFHDDMSLTHAHGLDATFAGHLPNPQEPRARGQPLVPGSHLVFFNHTFPESQLSIDGYDNSQAPVGNFPNRRWFGGSISFNLESQLRFGVPAVCEETVGDVRQSIDGRRINVSIDRTMRSEGDPAWAVREKRSMFYFDNDPRIVERQFKHIPPKYTPTHTRKVQPSRVLLFRYSALNFNAHLIHYDTIYSREQEKLPEVIVQGPLMVSMALWWFHTGILKDSKRRISSFTYRNLAPMTVEEEALFCAAPITEDLFEVWIQNPKGGVVLSGQLIIR